MSPTAAPPGATCTHCVGAPACIPSLGQDDCQRASLALRARREVSAWLCAHRWAAVPTRRTSAAFFGRMFALTTLRLMRFACLSLSVQRVPVETSVPVPKVLMSLLDANSSATELKEMPLWLAKGLKKQGFVSTWLPKTYSERSMQKMKAGASTVHLGQRYPYFYELGTEVAILDATQAGMEVVKTLEGAFAQRYKGILDRFHNTGNPHLALPPPSHGCCNAPARTAAHGHRRVQPQPDPGA